MKRMGGKDSTNAILANLRSKISKIFWGTIPRTPLDRRGSKNFLSKFLPENQPDYFETL